MNNGGHHFPIFLPVLLQQHFACCWESIDCDAVLCNFKLVFYCNIG